MSEWTSLPEILKQLTLSEAEQWLALCKEAGIVAYTLIPEHEAANA